jgi:hypothetical protein
VSEQIKFFEKSKADLDNINAKVTVTDTVAISDGQDIAHFVQNRNNTSAWLTTGSNDTANTTLEISLGDTTDITDIMLFDHNFKDFNIDYWNGLIWVNLSTIVDNTETTTLITYPTFPTDKIKITIGTTQIVDADKRLTQFIATELMGQLKSFPIISRTKVALNKKKNKMLSGKVSVTETSGFFSCELSVKLLKDNDDLTLLENIHFSRQGVLLLLSGGDEAQFSSRRLGYRNVDLFLVRPTTEWGADWYKGLYTSGMKIKIRLEESIN